MIVSPKLYPHECAILKPSTMLCSFTMLRMRGEGSALLIFRAAIIQEVLNSPKVQRSRSFGFTETV